MYSEITPDIANKMLEVSLEYCRKKLEMQDCHHLLVANDPEAVAYFRYKLSQEIGLYLGNTSELIKEVFIIPDNQDENLTVTLPLTLIVRVEKYTAALESVVNAIQAVILEEYRRKLSPIADQLQVYVNCCFVEEDEFLHRRGFAAAVGSLHNPAVKIWCRANYL